ncbi:MAG: UDP-N-acetylmuramoyl-L-alanyl-D-glutamate--2,6-diaminopimelate ligase [Pseudomonadota bacterium]
MHCARLPQAAALLQKLGVPVTGITADSRRAGAGVAFAAYAGTAHDGRSYIPQAIAAGAPAVLWEEEGFVWDPAWQVPNLPVPGLKQRIGEIAACVYGDPSSRLSMIGVTGTNGKTSVTHWIAQALNACGTPSAVIGTLGNGFVGQLAPAANTTPDAAELQEMLAQFVRAGARACAMEVSSHGLHQGRVNGCRFNVAVLTNLSRDHLDYHGSMQAYAEAKAGLFAWEGLAHAVLNLDDEFGRALAAKPSAAGVVGYGLGRGEVAAEIVKEGREGLLLSLNTAWGRAELESPLLGRFNAYNLLAALAALLVSGVPLEQACAALAQVRPPAGRMQTLGGGTHPLVVVDYAHTPDALEKVLATLRPLAGEGRVICVFGCGGNRDKGKRPLMGRAAVQGADLVLVTSDNPRNEDPLAIIADILQGAKNGPVRSEPDRARAIFEAIGAAKCGDIVLIAGKGHEDYQEVRGRKLHFSDAEVARKALEAWV